MPQPSLTRPSTRHRIVAVDDDPHNLALLRFSLGVDHDVVAVEAAEQALVALEQRRADVLLLDLGLPRIDGAALLSRLKQDPMRYGRPLVVVVSGNQDAGVRARVERLGVEAWFAKPFDPDLLQATIEVLVDAICCAEVPDDASSLTDGREDDTASVPAGLG